MCWWPVLVPGFYLKEIQIWTGQFQVRSRRQLPPATCLWVSNWINSTWATYQMSILLILQAWTVSFLLAHVLGIILPCFYLNFYFRQPECETKKELQTSNTWPQKPVIPLWFFQSILHFFVVPLGIPQNPHSTKQLHLRAKRLPPPHLVAD